MRTAAGTMKTAMTVAMPTLSPHPTHTQYTHSGLTHIAHTTHIHTASSMVRREKREERREKREERREKREERREKKREFTLPLSNLRYFMF
jgi:hypothetical protein